MPTTLLQYLVQITLLPSSWSLEYMLLLLKYSPHIYLKLLSPSPHMPDSSLKDQLRQGRTLIESKLILRETNKSIMTSALEIFVCQMAKEFWFDFLLQVQIQMEQLPASSGNTMVLFWLWVTFMVVNINATVATHDHWQRP